MKTRNLITMAALAGAVMMTSCSKDAPIDTKQEGAVEFFGSVGEAAVSNTRAAGTSWDPGDEIGIFMIEHNSNPKRIISNNIRYITPNGGGIFNVDNYKYRIYYPTNSSSFVDFIAYYPCTPQAGNLNSFDIEVEENQKKNNQPSFDYLWANANNNNMGYNKDYKHPIELQFKHLLSMIVLNVKAGNGVTIDDADNSLSVSIRGMQRNAVFDVKEGSISPKTGIDTGIINPCKWINAHEGYYATYDAIIIPDTHENSNLSFKVGNTTYTFDISDIEFKSGHEHILNVSIQKTEVKVEGIIKPWLTEDGDKQYISVT